MNRRAVITLLGGAAARRPRGRSRRADSNRRCRRSDFSAADRLASPRVWLPPFAKDCAKLGLSRAGTSRSLSGWADGRYDSLPAPAAETRRQPLTKRDQRDVRCCHRYSSDRDDIRNERGKDEGGSPHRRLSLC